VKAIAAITITAIPGPRAPVRPAGCAARSQEPNIHAAAPSRAADASAGTTGLSQAIVRRSRMSSDDTICGTSRTAGI